MPTDAELLRQYVQEGSESAFAELVRRYLGLVYSAAVRQAGGNGSLAEDATQTVFIILARQGPSLVGHETLAGWLHTCTRYTTLRALRDVRRRQARELKAAIMEINEAPKTAWEEVRPLLDEAVSGLNATDRQAVLLRFFQCRSHREVGEALGVTEDAARVRVDRALEKLRRHFSGRGIVTTGALLSETILANAAEAEPTGLAGRVNATSTVGAATLGWNAWMLRLIFMTTKKKILIAIALVILAGLFTLSWPQWAGSSTSGKGDAGKSSSGSLNGKITVQAPQAAPVPASSSDAVVKAATQTAPAATSQPLTVTAPPAPPPPAMGGPGGARRGTGVGPGGDPNRRTYTNLFLELKLTPEQQDAFLKALNDKQAQAVAIRQAAQKNLSEEQMNALLQNVAKQMSDANDPSTVNPDAFGEKFNELVNDQLGITAQVKAINDSADAQIRQALGSDDNIQAYQTYNSQSGVRNWVTMAYGNALQRAAVDSLTPDQQEALVGIVANSLQPGDWGKLKELPQVVEQAAKILTPEQIEVLKTNPMGVGLNYALLHRAP